MIRGKPAGAARRERGRRGMTLIEVVIAMALLAFMLCAYMHLQYTTLEVGRISSLRTSGTIALRSQFERIIAAAYNNNMGGNTTGIAQGLITYLKEIKEERPQDAELVNGTIVYTFPVPMPGETINRGATNRDENAVGTLIVHLREEGVPAEFVTWDILHEGGAATPNNNGFDMNGNGYTNDDFSGWFEGDSGPEPKPNSLPVQGEIRYYNSKTDINSGAPVYRITRNFILNGDTFSNRWIF